MKKVFSKAICLLLATGMMFALAGCSSSAEQGTEQAGANSAQVSDNIVNIGVTDSLGGVNPIMMDQTNINKYAAELQFLPLMELDSKLNFQPMLAESGS